MESPNLYCSSWYECDERGDTLYGCYRDRRCQSYLFRCDKLELGLGFLDKHLAAPSAFMWWFLLLGCGWSGGWPLLRWFLLLSDGAFQLFIMLKDIGQRAIERIAIEKEGLIRCFVICLFLQFWLNGLSLLW